MEETVLRENTSEYHAVHWYALKVFFNKVFDIETYFKERQVESYFPCVKTVVVHKGVKKKVRRPVINSLMFFRSTEHEAVGYQKELTDRVILYTSIHCDKKIPAAIPEHEMKVFMLVTSTEEEGLDYFGEDASVFHKGEHVRVTGGMFEGAEGYIRRIKGNRRLVVAIQGICAVATTYIPQCFLEKIEDVSEEGNAADN